ncbi:hypothetical protein C6401_06795 [Arthrobacter woluwensis]|nr:hypothetical protein C6401_06795 [Arthrobacter woluwensis]
MGGDPSGRSGRTREGATFKVIGGLKVAQVAFCSGGQGQRTITRERRGRPFGLATSIVAFHRRESGC